MRRARATAIDHAPTSVPPASATVRRARPHAADPVEEALLCGTVWDWRETDPLAREVLDRFATGDEAGALAAAQALLSDHCVPALTVSPDVLDEIELDHRHAAVLACIDGMTSLSRVASSCDLSETDVLRAVCELVGRRIVVLRG